MRNIPGLQREPSKQCVVCGVSAELYCTACRITPYCGERCQRRDWETRHRAVCHNLARVPVVAPLRRPHSPTRKPNLNDSGSEKGTKKFSQPAERGHQRNPNQANVRNGNQNHQEGQNRNQINDPRGGNRNQNEESNRNSVQNARAGNRNQPEQNRNQTNNSVPGNRFQPEGQSRNQVANNHMAQNRQNGQQPLRRPMQPEQKPVITLVETKPKSQPVPVETKPKPQPAPVETKTVTKPAISSLEHVTPRKPLVPTSFVVEKLKVGTTFLAEVVALASNCGSKQAGYVCLTLHEDYGGVYDSLCDEFKGLCERDSEEYTPRIGETFAYFCEEEDSWYRARCLARTRAALLDAGRVVSFSPKSSRRLPAGFATIPEFMAVFKAKDLTIGCNLTCNVISAGTRVSLTDESGKTVQVDATRWLPELEYPTEPQLPVPQVQVKEPEITQKPVAAKKPLVPDSFVIEKLAKGTSFLMEVIALASNCETKQAGYVCLTLHEDYSDVYNSLCDEFKELCDKDSVHYTPGIGETFAYFDEDDGFWYRARCLARTRAALLDAGRVVSFSPRSSRRLPAAFANIPEFSAVVKAKSLMIGEHLSCKMLSTSDGIRVSFEEPSGKALIAIADAMRWLPDVEYPPEPISISTPTPVALPMIPEVPRPGVEHNAVYILLDVTSLRRACVRPSDPRIAAMFDSVLQDTLLYALKASPLKEPPQKGQTVVAKFLEDGNHYRALVKRVNVAMNKYLIEYIEYGNEEIVTLDRLYPCPPKLQIEAQPTQASIIKLSDREPSVLTPAARKYVDQLKENAVELILTIPGGARKEHSGGLVSLVIAKGCEPASKHIEDLCTPEWKKLAERGGDVLEMESCFYHELEYITLPTSRPFTLVTFCDIDTLAASAVSGYEKGDKAAHFVFTELSKQIEEYCESPLCKVPYLPRIEELCVTRHNQTKKWVRAVVVELAAGGSNARVLLVDTGELRTAAVRDLRKLPRELAAPPAAALHCDIQDFPSNVTRAQLERAMRVMGINGSGVGELKVTECRLTDENMYEIVAPELIAALTE